MGDRRIESKQKSFEILLEYKKAMDELNIPFYLDGGTLLGFYRDGDFCDEDEKDIDLTIFGSPVGQETILAILEKLCEAGFVLYHYWPKSEYVPATAQLSVKKEDVKVDMMFKEMKNDQAWWTVYGGQWKLTYKSVPSKHFEDQGHLKVKGHIFSVPVSLEEYLQMRYGDWQMPVHASKYSCYTSDLSIKESYEEI